MGRALILDTVTLIDYERERVDRRQFDNDDLAMAGVSIAEFRVGAELADTPDRKAARLQALVDLLAHVEALDYTEATAIEHALLLAHVRRIGRPRGAHDLIIAAHARETGRVVVSRDGSARFGDLPGVTAISPD